MGQGECSNSMPCLGRLACRFAIGNFLMRRRVKLVLGGLTLLGVGLSILAPYAWSRYQLRAAERALHRYDIGAAREHLEQSLGKWPGNSRALFLAAQTARRLDDCAEAERRLAEYEHRQGVTEEGRLEWLLLGIQQGDLGGQDSRLESLVQANDPATPLLLEALAKGFMNVARWNRMISCLDMLLKREPTNAPALVLRGKAWEGLHNPERALQDYERAVDLDPASREARLRLADTLQRLGRVREAVAHFELLLQCRPGDSAVLLGLARCRFDSHELDQAGELLDILLAAQPDHVAALVDRGRLALCRGQAADAEEKLSRAAALAPWHREAHRLLFSCLQTQGKSIETEACRTRLRELQASDNQMGRLALRYRNSPRDASIRFDLAKWAMQNGREQDGVRWLFATLLVDPQHGAAHSAVADYFQRIGQPWRSAEHRQLVGGEGGQRSTLEAVSNTHRLAPVPP
jgi:tetratricopeptide (TPR) repeat protein